MKSESLSSQIARLESLVAGIQKHLSTQPSLGLAGQTSTPAAVITLLTAVANAGNTLLAERAGTKDALAAYRQQSQAQAALVKALESYVRATYTDAATLADFGLSPRKAPTPLTAEQLALRAQRAKATREARGTKGSRQKAAIKGTDPAPAPAPQGAAAGKPAGASTTQA